MKWTEQNNEEIFEIENEPTSLAGMKLTSNIEI